MNELSIVTENYSYCTILDPEAIELHEHDAYELMYFVKINGVYFVEGKAFRLKPHDILLVPPATQHRIIMDAPGEYERYNVLISPSSLPEELLELLPKTDTIINASDDSFVYSIFMQYDLYVAQLDRATRRVGVDSLVRPLLFHMYLLSGQKKQKQTSKVNPLVTKATAYIQQNIDTIKDIDELCRELFVTKSHLHHMFKKYLMTTPKKYIMTKRLYEAQRLIRSGAFPGEVYSKCGFADYATFYRNYKGFFGHSPSEENYSEIVIEQYF